MRVRVDSPVSATRCREAFPSHRLLTAVFVALATLAPVSVAAQGRALTLEDYYSFRRATSPAISPDGTLVAYAVTEFLEEENQQHSEIWLASADGTTEPVRLTSPSFNATGPRWDPTGTVLSFTSQRPAADGSSTGSTWFLRMDRPSGEAYQISGLGGSPIFSPDGRQIAFTRPTPPPPAAAPTYASDFERKTVERFDGRSYDWMNYRFDRRGYLADPRDPDATPPRQLYVLDASGGEAIRVTTLDIDVRGPVWSHEGNRLAFTADAHQRDEHTYGRADLWLTDLSGNTSRVTDDEFDYASPSWSPSGREIVVRGTEGLDVVIREGRNRGAPSDLFVFRADSADPVVNLTAEWDYIPGAPTWGPDGRHVFFAASIGGNSHLFRVPAGGGVVEQLTSGDRRLNGFSFDADFSHVAFAATDPVSPPEIWISGLDGTGEMRLSGVNDALLSELDLSTPDRLVFESTGGTEIEGWVLPARGYAAGGGSFPMILQIHGGPHGAYGNAFSFEQQLLAARGFMVLFTNPRASTGYGETFRWGTWGGWGFNDYDDVMAGVDHAIDAYDVDTSRLGVTGYSYGGYLTNWIITQTDRFAAAVSGASISNWVSDYGVADIPRTKESEFFGPPWEEEGLENLLRSSPIIHAKGVSTPTLFVHGEADLRVPIEEGEQMYVALRKQQVPAKFVRYPESYHGGWTPWRTVHRMWVQLEWWDQWLAERATSQ